MSRYTIKKFLSAGIWGLVGVFVGSIGAKYTIASERSQGMKLITTQETSSKNKFQGYIDITAPIIQENQILQRCNRVFIHNKKNDFEKWSKFKSRVDFGQIQGQYWLDYANSTKIDKYDTEKLTPIKDMQYNIGEIYLENNNVIVNDDSGYIRIPSIKISSDTYEYITVARNNDTSHNWIHYQLEDAKDNTTYILAVDVKLDNISKTDSNNGWANIGEIMIGKYGDESTSLIKKFEAYTNKWERVYIAYHNEQGPLDIILYGHNTPVAYTNIAMYEVSEDIIKRSENTDQISNLLYEEDVKFRNEKKILQIDTVDTVGKQIDKQIQTILKRIFITDEWDATKKNKYESKLFLKNELINEGKKILPLLNKVHPGLTSNQYMLLYIQYITHNNLVVSRDPYIKSKDYYKQMEHLEAECSRLAKYTGELYNIMFGVYPNTITQYGHFILGGEDFVMDPSYNILFLVNSNTLNSIRGNPNSKDILLENVVVGYPAIKFNASELVDFKPKEEVIADYEYQLNRYLNPIELPFFMYNADKSKLR